MRGGLGFAMLLAWAGCGRIGYEPRVLDQDGPSPSDGQAGCPVGTTELTVGSATCIEQAERGTETWTDAKAICEGLGRRLCTDAEWFLGCTDAAGLVDMANDGNGNNPEWEWVAEEQAGVAQKRGYAACTDTSSHEIFIDAYDYRCCVDK